MTDVMVPALGESVSEATVATWFKKAGDAVAQDEMLCELETDKVSVEVPAPVAGVLAEILAPEGTTVAANARLAIISEGAAAAAPKKAEAPKAEPAPAAAAAPAKDVEDAPAAKKDMAGAGPVPRRGPRPRPRRPRDEGGRGRRRPKARPGPAPRRCGPRPGTHPPRAGSRR